jgi:hypothetical protein
MESPCENCGKNVLDQIGLAIETGLVTSCEGGANFNSSMMLPKEIKGDGFFCSFKCLLGWLKKQKKLTIDKSVIKDFKEWKK